MMDPRNKRFLFIFIDGIGIGPDDPNTNPFSKASLSCLSTLLGEKTLTQPNIPSQGKRHSLLSIDACLGVEGMPQSATGQAVLMTGINIPGIIGYHYGPKPNELITELISKENIFSVMTKAGKTVNFMNAYPQRFFDGINSGRRLLSSIPLAAVSAGFQLRTHNDLRQGMAISADLTGVGWHNHLKIQDTPIYTPYKSGELLARLTVDYDFSLVEYWLSDYAGHSQEMDYGLEILGIIDGMLSGLLDSWNDDDGLILITSDHGNLEDMSTHRHTKNPVPALVIGNQIYRNEFINGLTSLVDIAPAIYSFFSLVK